MNRIHQLHNLTWFILLLSLFIMTCSKESDVHIVAPLSIDSMVDKGWSDYSFGNYESAAIQFESALTQNAACYDAYNGLGWSYFRQGDYESAINYFQFLIPLQEVEPELAADAYAGLAAIYMTQNRDVDAVLSAWEVLAISGETYTFQHDPSITAEDIHILAARCLFNIGEFFLSQREINAVDPTFPSPSLIDARPMVETVTSLDSLEIELSYDSPTPVLYFETEESNVISISSITDTSGLIEYDLLYGYGEYRDFYITADPLPPLGTQFIVEYAYVLVYHDYLIVLAEKIETMVAF